MGMVRVTPTSRCMEYREGAEESRFSHCGVVLQILEYAPACPCSNRQERVDIHSRSQSLGDFALESLAAYFQLQL
jgi:hypothetical protein